MPTKGGFKVSIQLEGKELKEYAEPARDPGGWMQDGIRREVRRDADDVARCWVLSQTDKHFAIVLTALESQIMPVAMLVTCILDERRFEYECSSPRLVRRPAEWIFNSPKSSLQASWWPEEDEFAFGLVRASNAVEMGRRCFEGTIAVIVQPGSFREYEYNGGASCYSHPTPPAVEPTPGDDRNPRSPSGDALYVNENEYASRDHCTRLKRSKKGTAASGSHNCPASGSQNYHSQNTLVTDSDGEEFTSLTDWDEVSDILHDHEEGTSHKKSNGVPVSDKYFHPAGPVYTFIFHYNSFRHLQAQGMIDSSEVLLEQNNELQDELERLRQGLENTEKEKARVERELAKRKAEADQLKAELREAKKRKET